MILEKNRNGHIREVENFWNEAIKIVAPPLISPHIPVALEPQRLEKLQKCMFYFLGQNAIKIFACTHTRGHFKDKI
uniref:Uncharacterized protein n=1 Tax=Romanomermis culicivorax TaxID=13658 RepID=A0A915KZZ6_ROMCU